VIFKRCRLESKASGRDSPLLASLPSWRLVATSMQTSNRRRRRTWPREAASPDMSLSDAGSPSGVSGPWMILQTGCGSTGSQLIARSAARSPFERDSHDLVDQPGTVVAVSAACKRDHRHHRCVRSRARRACHWRARTGRKQNPTFTWPRRALEAELARRGHRDPPSLPTASCTVAPTSFSYADLTRCLRFGARENHRRPNRQRIAKVRRGG